MIQFHFDTYHHNMVQQLIGIMQSYYILLNVQLSSEQHVLLSTAFRDNLVNMFLRVAPFFRFQVVLKNWSAIVMPKNLVYFYLELA